MHVLFQKGHLRRLHVNFSRVHHHPLAPKLRYFPNRIHVCMVYLVYLPVDGWLIFVGKSRHTVDGRNPANHTKYKIPVTSGINYQPQLVCRISSIISIHHNGSYRWCKVGNHFMTVTEIAIGALRNRRNINHEYTVNIPRTYTWYLQYLWLTMLYIYIT